MAIVVRGIEVDVDPFVKRTFPKWMVQIEAEVDVSCSYRGTTDVREAKIDAIERIDPFGLVEVFDGLTDDERALLLLTPESKHSRWSEPGWGGGSGSRTATFKYLYPAGHHGIYRLIYTVSDGTYDEFGEHDKSTDVSYLVDNIIGVAVDKVTTRYYGVTRQFTAWLADATVSCEERRRRSAFAQKIAPKKE